MILKTIQVVNFINYYNTIRNNAETHNRFDCLPVKYQWVLRKNVSKMLDTAKNFDELKSDLVSKVQSEFITDEKSTLTEENGQEIRKVKDEFVEDYREKMTKAEIQLNEVANEDVDLDITPFNIEEIVELIDNNTLTLDDLDMLSLLESR